MKFQNKTYKTNIINLNISKQIKLYIIMTAYHRSNSQGNFMNRASKDSDKLIRRPPPNLISLPKDMYKLFNEFQLTQSRLYSLKEYQFLTEEIKKFNLQLKQWKENNGPSLRNIRMTYYFYENLYSRIKFVGSITSNKQSAQNSLREIIKWFAEEKPKIRGAPPKKPEGVMKAYQYLQEEQAQLQDMTQYSMRKRQMTPYQKMARTAHTNFFPPKERLLDYHKKDSIMDKKLTIDGDQVRELRLAKTTSSVNRNGNNKLRDTVTTFQQTKTTFLKTSMTGFNNKKQSLQSETKTTSNFNSVTPAQIMELKQPIENEQNIEIKQFSLQQKEGEEAKKQTEGKILDQEDMVKDMIEQPKFQQDEADEDQELVEQQQSKQKYKKVYQHDYDRQPVSSIQAQAEQNIKDHQQSTLRRLLKDKERQINRKLEDMNIVQNMNIWAKGRSFINGQMARKSESYRFINQFNKTEYQKKGFLEKRKELPEFDFRTQRSKTAQNVKPRAVQQDFEKQRIGEALKKYGRYLSGHVKVARTDDQNQQNNEQYKMMRATSLTVFSKGGKNKQFGQLLASNDVYLYNYQAVKDANRIKQKLAKKQLPLSNKKVFNALNAIQTQREEAITIFPKTINLLSNPFFPKHLYETKKKKKK